MGGIKITPMPNPMTTGADIIYAAAGGAPTRLANGTAGQVLQSNGTTVAPSWVSPINASYITLSSTTITSGTALRYITSKYDTNSAYNTATGVYTAPRAGKYRITIGSSYLSASVVDIDARVNGATINAAFQQIGTSFGRPAASVTVNCALNDTITLVPAGTVTAGATDGFMCIEYVGV